MIVANVVAMIKKKKETGNGIKRMMTRCRVRPLMPWTSSQICSRAFMPMALKSLLPARLSESAISSRRARVEPERRPCSPLWLFSCWMKSRDMQVVILSPTRELAEQHQRVFQSLGDFLNAKIHVCIGGKSLGLDLKELERGDAQIISGMPGRVYDLIRRNAHNTSHLKALILDEADEMLRYLCQCGLVSLRHRTKPRKSIRDHFDS
jgi:hypothetical protein